MNKSVEAILEVNAMCAQLGANVALKMNSEDRNERILAKKKFLAQIEIQHGTVVDLVQLFKDGITFEAWFKMFKKWTNMRQLDRICFDQKTAHKLYKKLMEEGDFEKYFEQHILPLEPLVPGMVSSNKTLAMYAEEIRRKKV